MRRVGNFLLKLLKITGFTVAGLVGLVLLVAIVLVVWPHLLLNDHTLGIARKLAARQGIELVWSEGHLRAESLSIFRKRVSLAFRDLCVTVPQPRPEGTLLANPPELLNACFDRFEVSAAGGLVKFKPRITDLGPVKIVATSIDYTAAAATAEKAQPKKESGSSELIPPILAGAHVHPLLIRVKHLKYETGEGKDRMLALAKFRLDTNTPDQGAAEVRAKLRARVQKGDENANRLRARIDLTNPDGLNALRNWTLRSKLDAALANGALARLTADADPRQEAGSAPPSNPKTKTALRDARDLDFDYRIRANYEKKKASAFATIEGRLKPDDLQGHLKATLHRFMPQAPMIWSPGCDFRVSERRGERMPGGLKLDCPVEARVPVAPVKDVDLKLPTTAGVRLRADLATGAFPPSADHAVNGTVRLDIMPILTPLLHGEGYVQSRIDGIPAEFPKDFKMDSDVSLSLAIAKFHHLTQKLWNTAWAVPAPLQNLRGRLELALRGKFDAAKGEFPLQLTTRLHSPVQHLDIDTSGVVKLKQLKPAPKAELDADVLLSKIALELPRLDLAMPPQLIPDSRIHPLALALASAPTAKEPMKDKKQEAGKAAAPAMLEYKVHIETPQDSPVKILTNLAKGPIPIAIDVDVTSAGAPAGQIRVENFPVEFFRRKATVDHFNLALANPTNQSPIDGAVNVDYADYKITVKVVGTVDKPAVVFESDPPLEQDQIVAVLLFGRTLDELDSDQSGSIGATNAAIADRALGLASLYALASTPIQSVGYDPRAGQVLVKVRLGEGVSLNLGAGTDPTTGTNTEQIGVRKRLSRHWAIETQLSSPGSTSTLSGTSATGSQSNVGTAFLEWTDRY